MICRSCKTETGEPVLDLGLSPVANAYPPADDTSPEPRYPLRLFVCPECFLVQVEDEAGCETHFNADYAYRSAASSSWRDHVERFAAKMIADLDLTEGKTVVEVGSNDGALAGAFAAAGVRTIGVDPAARAADDASARGVETVVGFFGAHLARDLRARGVVADLTCANNVLAHVPDMDDFVAGFAELLAHDGTATFEFPLVSELIRHNQYDTIYHEHYSYLSILALEPLFARHGLAIVDVERLSTHGGSARLFVRHAGLGQPSSRVDELKAEELALGLANLAHYRGFAARVAEHREALRGFLSDLKAQGLRIAGYAAPAKAATLFNYCEIGAETLDYVVDRATTKQGRRLPGTALRIDAPDRLEHDTPNVVLILAWNIAAEITEELAGLKARGVRFAVPMPWPGFLL